MALKSKRRLRGLRLMVPIAVVGIAVQNAASLHFNGSAGSPVGSNVYSNICMVSTKGSCFLANQLSMPSPRIPKYFSAERSFLIMGKGDGKKKRKKQSKSSSPSPQQSTPSQPAAPRVSNSINIPIRRQIEYGKLNKQFRESGTTSFRQKKLVRTKYRRSWDEEEMELKAEERRRKGQDPDWDVILNRTSTSPLVFLPMLISIVARVKKIVDGYNVIYKWSRLAKHMRKNDPARARQLLVDDLENLRSIKGWRIEVVFDGAGKDNRNGPLGETGQRRLSASDKANSKDVSKHGVRVVFTGTGIEADSYIEERCQVAKNVTGGEMTGSLIVATDDAMIRLAGQSAGALCMGTDRFVTELKAVKKAVAYRVEAAMAKVNGGRIRPEKLWGTSTFSSSPRIAGPANTTKAAKAPPIQGLDGVEETEDGRTVYTGRFGRNAIIIEDKRKKKK
eukprot:scaffold5817_cov101-Cylindrotheca_fusiformis.AAC.10